jgi:hypothetical protein
MELTRDQIVAMARGVGIEIPEADLDNVTLRLSALLTEMEAIERELGAHMDRADPVPPICLPEQE